MCYVLIGLYLFGNFLSVSALDNQFITTLTARTCFFTLGILTGSASGVSTGGLTFTTTHWVIYRVHGNTSYTGANTFPAVLSGFTCSLKVVITV
jgi:hypothetical protein